MKKILLKVFFVAGLAVLVGCKESAPVAKVKSPPQPIDVSVVIEKPIQPWYTYTTRLEAPEEVFLMPRVSGVIDSIEFVEGQQVQQGDLLFTLDARTFEAEVAKLKAQVENAQAALDLAIKEEKRAGRLLKRNAISIEEADARLSTVRMRYAELATYNAQLDAAELDLEFTSIKSPITGIISRAEITTGNNVVAHQSVLTNIVSNNVMYAYFDVDERTWNSSFSKIRGGSRLPAVLQLTGNREYTHQGVIDFVDNSINTTTGTLRVRATFKPEKDTLRAGAFARVRVAASEVSQQLLVPDRSIGTDLKNRFVLTVNENNVLEYRLVSVGERYGEYRVVTEGLRSSDVIAVNGSARVGPGMEIEPRTVELDTAGIQLTLSNNEELQHKLAGR